MKDSLKALGDRISKKKFPILTTAGLVLLTAGFQNCQRSDEYYEKADLVASRNVRFCQDGSSDNLICNPFGGPGTGDDTPGLSDRSGLIGYLFEGQDNWNDLGRYINEGYRHPEAIYFSNFNVPVRSFDEGFFLANDFLRDRSGERLIEWFGIRVEGQISLPIDKAEGAYHMATLSDDGISISVDGNLIVNNPGTHSVTRDCASSIIDFQRGVERDFELRYFQGPRYHIALMVFIKRIDRPGSFDTRNCASGNTPEALLAAGYEVVSPSWFTVPQGF